MSRSVYCFPAILAFLLSWHLLSSLPGSSLPPIDVAALPNSCLAQLFNSGSEEDQLPIVPYQLSLVGTLLKPEQPDLSQALIKTPDGHTRQYSRKQAIAGTPLKIAQVTAHYVVLSNSSGQQWRLPWPITQQVQTNS